MGGRLVTAGAAGGVLALALLGGAISGKLEHRATFGAPSPAISSSSAARASTTSTTTAADAALALQVRTDLVADMTLDLRCRRLDPNPRRRAVLAATPAAVARRRAEIAQAWAPDRVAATEFVYEKAVHADAINRARPSMTDAAFVFRSWSDVGIVGPTAHATLVGHYRLTEPASVGAPGGVVVEPDRTWRVSLRLSEGGWKLEDRTPSP